MYYETFGFLGKNLLDFEHIFAIWSLWSPQKIASQEANLASKSYFQ